ncbi:hypothetical protein HAX54_032594, partial [Datura stramonium]|nr:hypothetical protein [Datura stramonium]
EIKGGTTTSVFIPHQIRHAQEISAPLHGGAASNEHLTDSSGLLNGVTRDPKPSVDRRIDSRALATPIQSKLPVLSNIQVQSMVFIQDNMMGLGFNQHDGNEKIGQNQFWKAK